MSYDITLYPRQPGQDWDEVIAADELDGPAMDEAQLAAGVSTFRRIEARLREQLTEPVEVWVAEETDGDVLGELTATESGLQVELYDRSASVSFPAADRPDREAFHRLVRKAVRIVAEETGYEAYDPQLRAPFDGTIDETQAGESGSGDGLATAGGLAGGATAVGATAAGADGADDAPGDARPALDPRQDPRLLRRRARLYLIIGVALTALGLYRFATGDGGWLTWFILAIGAFDLIGGMLMQSMARQLDERELGAPGGTAETLDATDPPAGPTQR